VIIFLPFIFKKLVDNVYKQASEAKQFKGVVTKTEIHFSSLETNYIEVYVSNSL